MSSGRSRCVAREAAGRRALKVRFRSSPDNHDGGVGVLDYRPVMRERLGRRILLVVAPQTSREKRDADMHPAELDVGPPLPVVADDMGAHQAVSLTTDRRLMAEPERLGHRTSRMYLAGIGLSGPSLCQKMETTHQRLPSFINWNELMPRAKGSASLALRYDS